MKKATLVLALGIVSSVSPSYGQGSIFFNNYGASTDAIVTYYSPGWPFHGQPVASSYTAQLLYGFGTITDPSQLIFSDITQSFNPSTPGYFQGPIITIPGYSGGPVTFQVVAYQGPSWSLAIGARGGSELFTLPSIATGTTPVGEFGPSLKPFAVVYIPEPSTIALVGLGLVSLLTFRSRKL